MKLDEKEIEEVIGKLLEGEGTDGEQEEWVNSIRESVPFYEKIVNLVFWSDEELSPREILERAKQEHHTIML